MDSQTKLTRKQSSLLRSSPTIRSIHSLSSMADLDLGDLKDQKPHHHHHRRPSPPSPDSSPPTRWRPTALPPSPFSSPYSILRLIPFLAVASASLFASFAYLQTSEISTSENLLLALTFLAVALFFAGRNRHSIEKSFSLLKHLYLHNSINLTRFASSHTPHHRSRCSRSSVRWYIDPAAAAAFDDYAKSNSRFSSSLSFPVSTSSSAKSNRRARRGVEEEEEGAVEVYTNGDCYEGEFYKGKSNGSGVYTYFVNGKYEGDWVDGKYDGFGIESWAKGSRYRGQYRHGLRHGYGMYRFYTGDSYAGEWYKGQYHGVGVQRCSDGSCFVGEFKVGAKHGLGCYHFRNGDRYAGEYFGDKIHGFGVYHFAHGHCYEGSWHEGRKQGYGMYKFRSGDSKCGEWDCGSLKTSLPPLTDAVIRAVQAARKTAENAINLRKVDEQVKKAVMAANRAATAARVAAVKAVQNRMEEKRCDLDG